MRTWGCRQPRDQPGHSAGRDQASCRAVWNPGFTGSPSLRNAQECVLGRPGIRRCVFQDRVPSLEHSCLARVFTLEPELVLVPDPKFLASPKICRGCSSCQPVPPALPWAWQVAEGPGKHKGGLGRGPAGAVGAGGLLTKVVGQALGAGMGRVAGGPHPPWVVSTPPRGRLGSNSPVLPPRMAARACGSGGHGVRHPRPTPWAISCLPPGLRGGREQEVGAGGHTGVPGTHRLARCQQGRALASTQALPAPRCPHLPSPWWAEKEEDAPSPPLITPVVGWAHSESFQLKSSESRTPRQIYM